MKRRQVTTTFTGLAMAVFVSMLSGFYMGEFIDNNIDNGFLSFLAYYVAGCATTATAFAITKLYED